MLTCGEIAEQFQIDADTVRAWCCSGALKAINVAKNPRGPKPRWRISEAELAEFMAKRSNVKATLQPRARTARPRPKLRKLGIKFF